jgi:hypothetical protein
MQKTAVGGAIGLAKLALCPAARPRRKTTGINQVVMRDQVEWQAPIEGQLPAGEPAAHMRESRESLPPLNNVAMRSMADGTS